MAALWGVFISCACDGRADAELVSCARLGDKGAFAALVVRHADTARVLAERVLADPDLSHDACQEAIVIALVSLDRLARPGSFGPWLCGIALNVARRWLKETRHAGFLPDIHLADPAPGPDQIAEAAEVAERIRRAAAGLAPGQREAVLLFYLQGLSHREVATELGISIGAVKARRHQARSALQPRLSHLAEERPVMADATPSEATWVDVSIVGIRRPPGDEGRQRAHAVILKETRGTRELPIGVLPSAALSLAVILESVEMPRPMTHQFAASLVEAAGARLAEVRITQLIQGSFYAAAVIDGPTGQHEVDARPSDALSLAAISAAPVRVDERILNDPDAVGDTSWREYPEAEVDAAVAPTLSQTTRNREQNQ